jgi:hypothetical protein
MWSMRVNCWKMIRDTRNWWLPTDFIGEVNETFTKK